MSWFSFVLVFVFCVLVFNLVNQLLTCFCFPWLRFSMYLSAVCSSVHCCVLNATFWYLLCVCALVFVILKRIIVYLESPRLSSLTFCYRDKVIHCLSHNKRQRHTVQIARSGPCGPLKGSLHWQQFAVTKQPEDSRRHEQQRPLAMPQSWAEFDIM